MAVVTVEHDGQQQPSSSSSSATSGHGTAAGGNADRDYIMMDDLLQDMVDDDGGGGGDGDGGQAAVRAPEDVELFEEIANCLDHDDVLFGSPRWLENLREMKQAAIDPLYKYCPKQWQALLFYIQLLMLMAHHGWPDTSFNDLLCILAFTYPKDNKVPTNSYRAKKLIRPVAMKLKKFHTCPKHCILYRRSYENLESYLHCCMSRYKRNVGCRMM
jgi:hypothetical protein